MKPRHVNHYTDIKYVNTYFIEKLISINLKKVLIFISTFYNYKLLKCTIAKTKMLIPI